MTPVLGDPIPHKSMHASKAPIYIKIKNQRIFKKEEDRIYNDSALLLGEACQKCQ